MDKALVLITFISLVIIFVSNQQPTEGIIVDKFEKNGKLYITYGNYKRTFPKSTFVYQDVNVSQKVYIKHKLGGWFDAKKN